MFFTAVLKSRKNINNKKPWARRFSIKNKKINLINPNFFLKKFKMSKIIKKGIEKLKYREKIKLLNHRKLLNYRNDSFKKKTKIKNFLFEMHNY